MKADHQNRCVRAAPWCPAWGQCAALQADHADLGRNVLGQHSSRRHAALCSRFSSRSTRGETVASRTPWRQRRHTL